jgi:hypothetical protein
MNVHLVRKDIWVLASILSSKYKADFVWVGKIRQMRSRAVAVPYFAVIVTIRLVVIDETHENNGKPFQCYGLPYCVRVVSQYRIFHTHTSALTKLKLIRADFVWVWKITAHGTFTTRHWGHRLNQSYSARPFLIQSECWDNAPSQSRHGTSVPYVFHSHTESALRVVMVPWG